MASPQNRTCWGFKDNIDCAVCRKGCHNMSRMSKGITKWERYISQCRVKCDCPWYAGHDKQSHNGRKVTPIQKTQLLSLIKEGK